MAARQSTATSSHQARRILAAAQAASGVAVVAQAAADAAQSTATSAQSTATSAQTSADLKEQFTNRLINNPGYIVLQPSGLILEWGFSTVAGGAGTAVITYQKLTLGHFPYSLVCMISHACAAGELFSTSINNITITGGNVTHNIDVRRQAAGVTTAAANGIIIQWIAIGY